MLRYSTLPCTTLITLHYATLIAAHYKYNYNHNYNYNYNYSTLITLRYTTLHYAMLRYTTLHYATLRYMNSNYYYSYNYNYTTAHDTALHHITPHSLHHTTTTTASTLRYNYNSATRQLQLQLQLQLHYTTLHPVVVGDHRNHCNRSKKHNSNYLSVHQWIRSAIHASQQLTSPIMSYLWNFRHRLARYYW